MLEVGGKVFETRALFFLLLLPSSSPTFTLELLREFWRSTGAHGKAVVRVVAVDQAGNGRLERGVRGTFLGFRRDSRFFGSLIAFLSVVVRRLFRNASLVGYPRFFVSQARVFVVLGVLSRYLCCIVGVCVVFLDTLTPEFELYVRLRERRQWGSDFPEFVLWSLVARLCGVGWSPQLFVFFLVERQLDLSSVTARLRGSSCVVLSGLDIGLISQ
ncbi:hypothetical protein Taro_055567 [Colocasia esculenta]|uniref:Uncharacterized protein n=1 Tax=Colocasia esculenta TaxID=4460 RepID=A0A843XRM7_COLES|nr:hypothetical protein [Colocasia esculenta]